MGSESALFDFIAVSGLRACAVAIVGVTSVVRVRSSTMEQNITLASAVESVFPTVDRRITYWESAEFTNLVVWAPDCP